MPAAAVMASPLASLAPAFGDDYEKAALAKADSVSQAQTALAPGPDSDSARFITFSPYDDHLLDLETLDPQTQLVARALAVFDKTRSDYATAPYTESFNFSTVIGELRRLTSTTGLDWKKSSYFVVAFRSQIPPTTDYGDLSSLDKAAHREATDSGGLLRYWFDLPDADGRNLATCLWRSPADAHKAGHGPQHRKASSSVRSLYKEWRIERYRLVVGDGVQSWEVIPWVDE
ncbi:hypothetical protein F503_05643 [Ophiostoma piceae UAMH 11346]|uniref:Uncharacterized protein n=1 Tax=Ophiostoma piceae (strain UAMH 11346) TaxID=1262450 RepID=S3CUZ6_OPHP1|nr:hypothetical protein F503_05643 [Ophiostoma piceae UAMH 11346]